MNAVCPACAIGGADQGPLGLAPQKLAVGLVVRRQAPGDAGSSLVGTSTGGGNAIWCIVVTGIPICGDSGFGDGSGIATVAGRLCITEQGGGAEISEVNLKPELTGAE